jgi:hypothetical protein
LQLFILVFAFTIIPDDNSNPAQVNPMGKTQNEDERSLPFGEY